MTELEQEKMKFLLGMFASQMDAIQATSEDPKLKRFMETTGMMFNDIYKTKFKTGIVDDRAIIEDAVASLDEVNNFNLIIANEND